MLFPLKAIVRSSSRPSWLVALVLYSSCSLYFYLRKTNKTKRNLATLVENVALISSRKHLLFFLLLPPQISTRKDDGHNFFWLLCVEKDNWFGPSLVVVVVVLVVRFVRLPMDQMARPNGKRSPQHIGAKKREREREKVSCIIPPHPPFKMTPIVLGVLPARVTVVARFSCVHLGHAWAELKGTGQFQKKDGRCKENVNILRIEGRTKEEEERQTLDVTGRH